MKKITNVAIGGKSFILSEEACDRLENYLSVFRSKVVPAAQADDVMVEIEERIAELFGDAAPTSVSVVDVADVERVISILGMPDGSAFPEGQGSTPASSPKPVRKVYRNPDDKKLGGVCGGIAAYLDVDSLLMRLVLIGLVLCGTAGFWIYIIMWLIIPKAHTPLQKCELHGEEPTAANLRKYSNIK